MFDTASIEIADARADDGPTIAAIHAESWRMNYRSALTDSFLDGDCVRNRLEVWRERLAAPSSDQLVLVARRKRRDLPTGTDPGSIVGFACAYLREDPQWGTLLDNLHVVPDAQRSGIGTALMAGVARRSHARDPRVGLYLWVLDQNHKARRFYERLHASDVGGDIWAAPGGGSVPRRRYAWRDLERLRLHPAG